MRSCSWYAFAGGEENIGARYVQISWTLSSKQNILKGIFRRSIGIVEFCDEWKISKYEISRTFELAARRQREYFTDNLFV